MPPQQYETHPFLCLKLCLLKSTIYQEEGATLASLHTCSPKEPTQSNFVLENIHHSQNESKEFPWPWFDWTPNTCDLWLMSKLVCGGQILWVVGSGHQVFETAHCHISCKPWRAKIDFCIWGEFQCHEDGSPCSVKLHLKFLVPHSL